MFELFCKCFRDVKRRVVLFWQRNEKVDVNYVLIYSNVKLEVFRYNERVMGSWAWVGGGGGEKLRNSL